MGGIGLGAAFERARSDPNLLSLREAIAACEARTEQLMERLVECRDDETVRREVWGELMACFEQRRKLTETEAKTRERAYRVLTSGEIVAIMDALVAIVTRHVTDRDTLAKIGRDIRALQTRGGGGG
jgi:hypothetical protein